jgi:hypothetical protein
MRVAIGTGDGVGLGAAVGVGEGMAIGRFEAAVAVAGGWVPAQEAVRQLVTPQADATKEAARASASAA